MRRFWKEKNEEGARYIVGKGIDLWNEVDFFFSLTKIHMINEKKIASWRKWPCTALEKTMSKDTGLYKL